MTTKVFWQDPYLTELNTTIKTVHGNQVTLSETILYAFSGGQESDSGEIGPFPVLKAEKAGNEILYTLPDNHNLSIGDTVTTTVNWGRRYKLMRLHFAAEIVLELAYKKLPNIKKVGAHIAENKARIDFEWDQKITPFIQSLENEAQKVIDSDQPIISAFSDKEKEQRYWKIENFGQVPCGGTHIKRAGEIGNISLKRKNPGKGIERIEILI